MIYERDLYVPCEVYHLLVPAHILTKDSHNIGHDTRVADANLGVS